jgi:iron-sulfur cluster repair protein YtfE (RIC family)
MADHCSCHHDAPTALETSHSPVHAEQIVADVAGRRAGALEVMKQMGINHCCGAHLTLREAAAAAGVSLDALLAALNEPRKAPA